MTAQIASGYLSNATRTVAEMETALENVRSLLCETIGGIAESAAVTLAANAVVPANNLMVIPLLPSSGTADNFSTITTTNTRDGQLFLFRNSNSANTITVKHGTANIFLADSLDCALNNVNQYLALMQRGSNFYEVFRTERTNINALPGGLGEASITLTASNQISPTQSSSKMDTNAGAGTQNLDQIATTAPNLLILRATNASHVITMRNNQTPAGGFWTILTWDGNPATFDSVSKFMILEKDTAATAFREVTRGGFTTGATITFTRLAKSANFSATDSAGAFYEVDTTSSPVMTLPTSPADGSVRKVYVTTASANPLTINTTGGQTLLKAGVDISGSTIVKTSGVMEYVATTGGYIVT